MPHIRKKSSRNDPDGSGVQTGTKTRLGKNDQRPLGNSYWREKVIWLLLLTFCLMEQRWKSWNKYCLSRERLMCAPRSRYEDYLHRLQRSDPSCPPGPSAPLSQRETTTHTHTYNVSLLKSPSQHLFNLHNYAMFAFPDTSPFLTSADDAKMFSIYSREAA